ncbi:MAG: hypothetical protein COV75_01275 [Candidatus Omnitrophica bacterium CG11_big_fil_rev_8_21_14_0_20_63_9]|nr:MAG: hypothetical protein COV75_01275 [Candidatus Omnitrophica bacterium CG11_big_fil_rev_8_21_14_0_20_63_9]
MSNQQRGIALVVAMGVWGILLGGPAFAAEHGGTATQEHGGTTQEHGGQAVKAEPPAAQIRQTIEAHVKGLEAKDGAFNIKDDVTGTTRNLTFVRVHDRVGKTGNLFYSCTDMRDTTTGELLDLDFDVDAAGGPLKVVDARIHKVNNQARYTYDDKDNRIPLTPAGR